MTAKPPLQGALIGCGFVSRHHLEAWSKIPDATITAICDMDPQRLEEAAARCPGARSYRDAHTLFEEGRFDFVEICTRPESHREFVELAARHGAHVLCQKPACYVRPDFRAMIECCDTAGVRLMIHENWRFRPWYRAMRAEIDAGNIGRPIRLRIAHLDTRALRADGFADQPSLATSRRLILMEMGCHLIDTARYLIGEIQTVAATTGHFGKGHPGEDLATLSVYFAGGARGLLDMSWCAPPDLARPEWALNETVVEGNAGAIKLLVDGSLQLVRLSGKVERRPVPIPPDDQVYVEGYLATQSHFIAGLVNDTEHETRGTDNLKTMDVVWGAYRAAEEGCTISL
ncbi:MAG: Gfo/Idh/MocA family oxidoreductase [Isosphaeraceae bacterium]